MSDPGRFDLHVKAASDGQSLGDCPFSQRAYMFMKLKLRDDTYNIKPINLLKKPQWFLEMNPAGSVPILVDHKESDKVIPDSAEIVKYINNLFPEPDCKLEYDGTAKAVCSSVFPKFSEFMKNKDAGKNDELRSALLNELEKLDQYLEGPEHQGEFMLGNNICDVDCMILPKLRHVMVAGKHYKNFNIPLNLQALRKYIENGDKCSIFTSTCYPDEEIVKGWAKHA